jgi:type VI secretion system protein ImpM
MPAGTCEPDAASPLSGVGFCGKLQSHGDFVRRRVPSTLLRRWEEWADAAMAAIRRHLGDNWPGSYLNSPIWRFAVSANCCGERPFLGIMMPSVDKVGRYHPLTILAALEATACAASIAVESTSWYADMEVIALSALEDAFSFAEFDARLAGAAIPSGTAVAPLGTGRPAAFSGACDRAAAGVLAGILDAKSVPYSLWWTVGSGGQPDLYCGYAGLPAPEDFRDLMLAAVPAVIVQNGGAS